MSIIAEIEKKYKKSHIVEVKSGDTVRVHQKIREGNKERVQVFEGLVIRTKRPNSHTASITVRRIASGVGVEKTYLVHSPLVTKIQVVKRSKVRRNYLSYMRARTGKAARLSSVDFDQEQVNAVPESPKEEKAEEPKDEQQEQPETKEEPKPEKESSEKTEAVKPEASEDKKEDEPKKDSPKAEESKDSKG